jgi:hypothetical protein
MEAEHMAFLYCKTQWLSHAQGLHMVLILREATVIFLSDSNKNYDANLSHHETFIQKLAYLVDISGKLSNLNKSMKDTRNIILTQHDKFKAFMKKLELWKRNTEYIISDMFPTLE